MIGTTICACCLALSTSPDPASLAPEIVEHRTVELTQTVTLHDIPVGAKVVRMWVPVPSDAAWQRVVDRQVVSAPGEWKLVRQAEGRGDFVFAELHDPPAGTAAVVVTCKVQTEGIHMPLDQAPTSGTLQPELFADALDKHAPLMEVDARIQKMADQICGSERDPAKQAQLLLKAVSDAADHYSKDPSKPNCGRGAATDCLDHGGGCCTDLHSLFISLARARSIPARMQYGYRLLDAKAGQPFDPGYRCWVEFFVPGAGWVPNDIVASDNADAALPLRWASLSASRVWLWEGRSFELTPRANAGPIHTMTCGWAEIDGKAVDPLPGKDGKPPSLRRTATFKVIETDRGPTTAKLPE